MAFSPGPNDYYYLVARHSGKVLSVANASSASGARIQQAEPADEKHRHFKFDAVSTRLFVIRVKYSDLVVGRPSSVFTDPDLQKNGSQSTSSSGDRPGVWFGIWLVPSGAVCIGPERVGPMDAVLFRQRVPDCPMHRGCTWCLPDFSRF